MHIMKLVFIVLMSIALALGQRPFFAGTRPIGYPEIISGSSDSLGNRFGDGDNSTTTQRLPIEALGDRDLVDRLSKLPIDKQPFWLINWQALEANRRNPQTYPQRPSQFAESLAPSPNTGPTTSNSNSASANTNFQRVNPNPSTSSATVNTASSAITNSPLDNRNADDSMKTSNNSEEFVNRNGAASANVSDNTANVNKKKTDSIKNNVEPNKRGDDSASVNSETANKNTNLSFQNGNKDTNSVLGNINNASSEHSQRAPTKPNQGLVNSHPTKAETDTALGNRFTDETANSDDSDYSDDDDFDVQYPNSPHNHHHHHSGHLYHNH